MNLSSLNQIRRLASVGLFHAHGHELGLRYEEWSTPSGVVRVWSDGRAETLTGEEIQRSPHVSTVVHGRRWSTYRFNDFDDLPDAAGTYVAYSSLWVVYIGQSISISNRWRQHNPNEIGTGSDGTPLLFHRDWGTLADFRLKVRLDRRFGERLMREARLLKKLKPKFNSAGVRWGVARPSDE